MQRLMMGFTQAELANESGVGRRRLGLIERGLTFWHPSYRQEQS